MTVLVITLMLILSSACGSPDSSPEEVKTSKAIEEVSVPLPPAFPLTKIYSKTKES